MATHSSSFAWESHGQRNLVGCTPWSPKRVGHNLATKQQQNNSCICSQFQNWLAPLMCMGPLLLPWREPSFTPKRAGSVQVWFLYQIWRRAMMGRVFLLVGSSLSSLRICHAIPFWLVEFLSKNQLIAWWEFPCTLFVIILLLFLIFYLWL